MEAFRLNHNGQNPTAHWVRGRQKALFDQAAEAKKRKDAEQTRISKQPVSDAETSDPDDNMSEIRHSTSLSQDKTPRAQSLDAQDTNNNRKARKDSLRIPKKRSRPVSRMLLNPDNAPLRKKRKFAMPMARTTRIVKRRNPSFRTAHNNWDNFNMNSQQPLIDVDHQTALGLLHSDPSPDLMASKPNDRPQYIYDRRETEFEKFKAQFPGDEKGAEALWLCKYVHRITSIRITAI